MFIAAGVTQVFGDGDVVFRETEPGRHMYVIEGGGIELTRTSMREGRDVVTRLTVLGSGDFFGEMALFDEGPRSATATAIGDTVLKRISRGDLEEAMLEDPELATKFLDRMSERLRKTDQALERLMVEEQLSQDSADDLEAVRYAEHL